MANWILGHFRPLKTKFKLRKPRFLSPLSKTRVQYAAACSLYCILSVYFDCPEPSWARAANLASTLRHRTQIKWRGYKYTSVQSTLCPSVQFIHLTLPWIKSKSFWKSPSLSILQLHSACHSQRKRRSKGFLCQGKCWWRFNQQTANENEESRRQMLRKEDSTNNWSKLFCCLNLNCQQASQLTKK